MSAERFLLLETKDALLELMEAAVVLTSGLKSVVQGKPQALTLEKQDFPLGQNHKGRKLPVYQMKNAKSDQKGVKAYVCDYETGKIKHTMLHNTADFCFTWTMNGCTFGIGSATPQAAVLVSHGNAAGVSQTGETQQQAQARMARTVHGPKVMMLEPQAYRVGNEHATTFGVRDSSGWNFYYQSWIPNGLAGLRLLGVYPIA